MIPLESWTFARVASHFKRFNRSAVILNIKILNTRNRGVIWKKDREKEEEASR